MNISLASPLVSLTFQDFPEPDAHAGIVTFIGCPHGCKDCHNQFLWNKSSLVPINPEDYKGAYDLAGAYFDFSGFEVASRAIDHELARMQTNKLVLQGGEPLLSGPNLELTKYLCRDPRYEVCIYTGYDLSLSWIEAARLTGFKYIKTGRFIVEAKRSSYKTDKEMVFASPNQELYDSEFRRLSYNGVYTFKE